VYPDSAARRCGNDRRQATATDRQVVFPTPRRSTGEGHFERRLRSQFHQVRGGKANDAWQPLEDVVSKDIFTAEVRAWAVRIRVDPKELLVRPMTRKWGSCSTAGRVTFDVELMSQPADFRKELIVHELLHLKVPNHGKLFRSLLRAYLGRSNVGLLKKPVAATAGSK
jgi:hypothetical protein